MKLLVTGAAGEFGRDLVPWLAQRHEVRATDVVPTDCPCEFVQADLRDPEQVAGVVAGIEGVIHLAVILPVPRPTADFVDVNTKAPTLLCEAAVAAGVQRLVYISTVWATGHGTQEGYQPVDEKAPWLPVDIYGLTKLQGELACEFYARNRGLSTLVVRMCGYRRCAEFAPDGTVDLAHANLGAIVQDLLRPGQKLCTPHDLGRAMEAAVLLHGIGFERIIVGNHVPWHPEDLPQLGAHPIGVVERYYPGAARLLSDFGVTLAPVEFYYSTLRARQLLGFRQEYTVNDIIAAHKPRH